MKTLFRVCVLAAFASLFAASLNAQTRRKVIIDQDCAGPGGTDMQAILALINSPETDVLGITDGHFREDAYGERIDRAGAP